MSADRIPPATYLALRGWLLANDPDAPGLLEWASTRCRPPETADDLAAEIVWIILCAGRSAQAARTIEKRVWLALREGRPVVEAFGYRAKAAAIERAWRERETDFAAFREVLAANDPAKLIEWCGTIPFVGDDTKFQLSKNCGVACPKPDIWLSRLAGFPDKPRRNWRVRFDGCMALCRALSDASGDSIAAVDTLLWLACNKGVLTVSPDAGPVAFIPRPITARNIWAQTPSVAPAPTQLDLFAQAEEP